MIVFIILNFILLFLFIKSIIKQNGKYNIIQNIISVNLIYCILFFIYLLHTNYNYYFQFNFYLYILILLLTILTFVAEKILKLRYSGLVTLVYVIIFCFIFIFTKNKRFLIYDENYSLPNHQIFFHTITGILAYSGFLLSSSVGLLYIIFGRSIKHKKFSILNYSVPSLKTLDIINYKIIQISFVFFTISITIGIFVLYKIKHTIFLFDGKIIFSVIIWFYYLTNLHLRFIKNIKGMKFAYITVIGIFVILITFFGFSLFSHGEMHGIK